MIDTLEIQKNIIKETRINSVDFDNIIFGRVYSDHMFVSDYISGEWTNFEIRPYGKLNLSPGTSALHYGQAIFEGLKAYRSEDGAINVFRPLDNWQRMNNSAKRMCIPQIEEEVFMGGLTELISQDRDWVPDNAKTSLYIRPFIFATDEYVGIRPSDTYKFIIFTCPVGAYYSAPVKVKIETHYTRAIKGGTGYAKAAGNYAGSLYPTLLAVKEGYNQLIWTDGQEHKYIEEAGTMNLLFIIDDVLVTAPTGDTILKGITRDSVLTLAKDWGMKVEERLLEVKELVDAIKTGRLKEAFGAGTAATIAHISAIGYEGVDYELPPVENREFSNKIGKTLAAIKTGKIEDKFGWIYKV
jgi:branched-chain amino acid aminotransferase